jgi:mannose-6-phosphate isomerase-like protein (cupin superfamily)
VEAHQVAGNLLDGGSGPVEVVADEEPAAPFGGVEVTHRALRSHRYGRAVPDDLRFERSPAVREWEAGRAEMRYRDLLPQRQGGRFIASNIVIPDGGPVPDYVHHHGVRFQTIFCVRGWAQVVYEDQGAPFRLEAGDCVLQPPGIRHRVLESSAGLEVVEVTSPAEHQTFADDQLELPTPTRNPSRQFDGQRFVRHRAAEALWRPWRLAGFECREAGIGPATCGLAEVRVVRVARPTGAAIVEPQVVEHDGELQFWFVLAGSLSLSVDDRCEELGDGDAVAIPARTAHAVEGWSGDLELLEVTLPA